MAALTTPTPPERLFRAGLARGAPYGWRPRASKRQGVDALRQVGKGGRGSAWPAGRQAGGRASRSRSPAGRAEGRPNQRPEARPSVRAEPLSAAAVGVARSPFPPPGDASPGCSPQCHPDPPRARSAPPRPAPRRPARLAPGPPPTPSSQSPPSGAGPAAVTCAGSRQARPLLRRGDSQMVRQEELPPRPLRPAPRAPRWLPASP